MGKDAKIDFYQVEIPEDDISFDYIINQYIKIKFELSKRSFKVRDHYIRLHDAFFEDGLYFGRFVKIRMDNLPEEAGLDGSLEDLGLGENRGLGESSFFLYSPKLNVLLFHRNSHGIRASGVAYYFEKITDVHTIEFIPIIEPDIMAKLLRMKIMREFRFKLAQPQNASFLQSSDVSLGSALGIMHEHGAANIAITLSMGQEKGTLSAETVKNWAKALMKIRSKKEEQVQTLLIRGKEYTDEKIEPIDLIQHRMVKSIPLPISNRRIYAKDMYEGLKKLYHNERNNLKKIFKRN